MKEHEMKAIRQRTILAGHDDHCIKDTMALIDEVRRLRLALSDVADLTGDPCILRHIKQALES